MRTTIGFLIILLLAFYGSSQKAVIYSFMFRIDNELITQTKAQNKDHKILNLSTIEDMPKSVSDTILVLSEGALLELLSMELSSILPEEKLVMGALPEHLMYLPQTTFKKAVQSVEADAYVSISCHVAASGGTKITLGSNSYSKVKPKITLDITVFDSSKEKLKEYEVELKDFEKLRSRTYEKTYGFMGVQNTDEMTESETLTSNDILRMFVMALEQLE